MYSKTFAVVCLAAIFFNCCQKSKTSITPMASLNLINATVGTTAIKSNWTNLVNKSQSQYYGQISTTVGYGANYVYGVLANRDVPLTIIATTDTVNPIFTANLNLSSGSIYSFYLAGHTGAVDTILVKEVIPAYGDSSCGVRFINLVYNSNPIDIRQKSTPGIIDFSTIGYKQYSSFKQYGARVVNTTDTFQVVDHTTSAVLTTYVLSTPYFQNVTLAWIGQSGGAAANAPKVIRINNY